MSKALATLATQPLIVAKVGLQSKPPRQRQGKPFKGFIEVMQFIIKHEGLLGLFKGIGPQILKGLLVQGILMMTKERLVGICSSELDSKKLTVLLGWNYSSSPSLDMCASFGRSSWRRLPSWRLRLR
jgi:hypothetical protein